MPARVVHPLLFLGLPVLRTSRSDGSKLVSYPLDQHCQVAVLDVTSVMPGSIGLDFQTDPLVRPNELPNQNNWLGDIAVSPQPHNSRSDLKEPEPKI